MTTPRNVVDVLTAMLRDEIIGVPELHARKLAAKITMKLTTAGFAVVALPEPCPHPGDGRPGWWDTIRTASIPANPESKGVMFDGWHISNTAARRLAAALLAAANHQENR